MAACILCCGRNRLQLSKRDSDPELVIRIKLLQEFGIKSKEPTNRDRIQENVTISPAIVTKDGQTLLKSLIDKPQRAQVYLEQYKKPGIGQDSRTYKFRVVKTSNATRSNPTTSNAKTSHAKTQCVGDASF